LQFDGDVHALLIVMIDIDDFTSLSYDPLIDPEMNLAPEHIV